MENGVASFDLSSDGTPSYFKSSFARSMAFNTSSSSGSKSLDYVYMDDVSTIKEEAEQRRSPPRSTRPRRSVPALPTFDPNFPRPRGNDALKFWKMKQESVKASSQDNHHWLQNGDSLLQEESKEEEILRLRKECQSLMEANRKLQAGASSIDSSILQSQIDTLQWQLKQAESNRQMYRAVMEQVSKFLERVHKALEMSPSKSHPSRAKSRSRSVHTVVSQSRGSSPSHGSSVHRANSISQMQDTSYTTFRDHACRRGSRSSPEEVSPERLSQDAFRLLRTVQSLLATREPDLARVTESNSTSQMGSCTSLAQGSCKDDEKATTPQPSVGSTEDESGFSSMSSFHEAGPSNTSTTEGSHHELGLPLVEPHRHRRWSSTPADTGFREPLRVLWV
nr:uncharacterized protein LOC106681459 isoform X3 [Halyomorpha halys]